MMKKGLWLVVLCTLLHSCVWKTDYSYLEKEDEMFHTWRSHMSQLQTDYLMPAFVFDVWYKGNDTIRSMVESTYLSDYIIEQGNEPGTYNLYSRGHSDRDLEVVIETRGLSLCAPGHTWTITRNYRSNDVPRYQSFLYSLFMNTSSMDISCLGLDQWQIKLAYSMDTANKVDFNIVKLDTLPMWRFAESTLQWEGDACFDLVETVGLDTTYTQLYSVIEQPLRTEQSFALQEGAVKIWAERSDKKSTTVLIVYDDNQRKIER